jgi:hypothetical protein
MKYLQDDRLSAVTSRLFSPDSSIYLQGNPVVMMNSSSPATPAMDGGAGGRFRTGAGAVGMVPDRLTSSSSRRVRGKVEAYTMKRTSTDKKYASHLGIKYVTSLQQRNNLNKYPNHFSVGSHLNASAFGEMPMHRASSLGMMGEYGSDIRFGVGKEAASTGVDHQQGLSKKRRSQSVGYHGEVIVSGTSQGQQRDDWTDGHHSKKARGRSNSLDEKNCRSSVLAYHTSLGDFSMQETRRLMTDLILTLNSSFPDYDFAEVSPNDFVKVPLHDVVRNVQSLLVSDSTSSTPAASSPPMPSPAAPPPGEAVAQDRDRDQEESNLFSVQEDAAIPRSDQLLLLDDTGTVATGTISQGNDYGFIAGTKNLLLAELWSALDGVVQLGDCDVYQWTSAPDGLLAEDDDDEGANSGGAGDVVTVWSFYYLFVNKNLKRIVFFCCSETLANRLAPSDADPSSSSYMEDVVDEVGADDGAVGMTIQEYDSDNGLDVDLVSEQDEDDDDDEDDVVTPSQHYKMMLSSGDASSTEVDFDLDPADVAAGGIPVSSV